MVDQAKMKTVLEQQLDELKRRLSHLQVDLSEPLNRDSSEQAVEKEDDESLEAQAMLVTREIESVSRAIARIEEGEYGICVKCGAEISLARLEARPEAALCINCAR